MHDERGHEIFEHRARPGLQRRGTAERRQRAAEPEPVPCRDVALGDGEETRQPCFRGQKIIDISIQLLVVDPIADGEKLPVLVVEECEVHSLRQFAAGIRNTRKPFGQIGRQRISLDEAFAVAAMAFGPVGDGFDRFQQRKIVVARLCHLRRDAERALLEVLQMMRDGGVFALLHQIVETGEHLEQVSPYRLGHAQRLRHGLAQQRDGVTQPVIAAGRHRIGRHLRAGVFDHQQIAGEIAAIDGGDVARVERLQCRRVVPVEEMAAIARQPQQAGDSRIQPLDGFVGADPAEIARRDNAAEIEPDIGGRGAVRDERLRIFLIIVRWEHVVFRRDEPLEEQPCAPRRQPQGATVGFGHFQMRLGLRRLARPARDERRERPEREKRRAGNKIVWRLPGDGGHRQSGEGKAAHKLEGERAIGAFAAAIGALRECHPFQQILAADDEAKQRARDRVQGKIGHARKKGDREDKLGDREQRVPAEIAKMRTPRKSPPRWQNSADDGQQRRQHDHDAQK